MLLKPKTEFVVELLVIFTTQNCSLKIWRFSESHMLIDDLNAYLYFQNTGCSMASLKLIDDLIPTPSRYHKNASKTNGRLWSVISLGQSILSLHGQDEHSFFKKSPYALVKTFCN